MTTYDIELIILREKKLELKKQLFLLENRIEEIEYCKNQMEMISCQITNLVRNWITSLSKKLSHKNIMYNDLNRNIQNENIMYDDLDRNIRKFIIDQHYNSTHNMAILEKKSNIIEFVINMPRSDIIICHYDTLYVISSHEIYMFDKKQRLHYTYDTIILLITIFLSFEEFKINYSGENVYIQISCDKITQNELYDKINQIHQILVGKFLIRSNPLVINND